MPVHPGRRFQTTDGLTFAPYVPEEGKGTNPRSVRLWYNGDAFYSSDADGYPVDWSEERLVGWFIDENGNRLESVNGADQEERDHKEAVDEFLHGE